MRGSLFLSSFNRDVLVFKERRGGYGLRERIQWKQQNCVQGCVKGQEVDGSQEVERDWSVQDVEQATDPCSPSQNRFLACTYAVIQADTKENHSNNEWTFSASWNCETLCDKNLYNSLKFFRVHLLQNGDGNLSKIGFDMMGFVPWGIGIWSNLELNYLPQLLHDPLDKTENH